MGCAATTTTSSEGDRGYQTAMSGTFKASAPYLTSPDTSVKNKSILKYGNISLEGLYLNIRKAAGTQGWFR